MTAVTAKVSSDTPPNTASAIHTSRHNPAGASPTRRPITTSTPAAAAVKNRPNAR
jgi:hypothetical protein